MTKRFFIFSEKQTEILIFLLAFLIFSVTISNGLNVFDFISYANLIQQSFKTDDYFLPFQAFGSYGGGQGGLSRNFLYIVVSSPFTYLFSNLLNMNIELTLNIFSAIVTSLSAVFVYKISRLFFNKRKSMLSTLLYLLIPFIFFNGINATTYSFQLFTSSVWIYFLLKAIKTKTEKFGLISSLVFVANTLVSLSGAPLIFAQIYGLTKISKKIDWLVKNFAILLIVVALVYYFSFVNKAYPTTFNLLNVLFISSLFIWESINGLSIAFFIFISLSLFYLVVRILKRKFDYFDVIFALSFISLLSSLIIFQFIPIANFTPIFAFLPVLFIKTFYNNKFFRFIILVILIFEFVKISPLIYQFHTYPHPHKDYSLWLNQIAQGSVVLAGHECPWIQYYTNLTFVCRARDLQQIDLQGKKIIVTEEYFKNENQMEFEYLLNSFNLPFANAVKEELGKPDVIANRTVTKIADYPYNVRAIEDPYQWLYTTYPKIYLSVFMNLEFVKPRYAIYSAV